MARRRGVGYQEVGPVWSNRPMVGTRSSSEVVDCAVIHAVLAVAENLNAHSSRSR